MKNTMLLWKVDGFQSSSVKSLYFGKTANGQDCIGCAWDKYSVYVFAYEGIIDTFLYYLELYNSVGQAMSATKLRDGMEEGVFFKPCPANTPIQRQWYRLRIVEMEGMENLLVHEFMSHETPRHVILKLKYDGSLTKEPSKLGETHKRRESVPA